MKKKLLDKMFSIGLLGIILAAFFSCLMSYQTFSSQIQNDVGRLIHTYAKLYEQSGGKFPVVPDSANDYRLTLIDTDGTVLNDSKAEGILENHADRPEVQQAIHTGSGSDMRMSSTLSVQTFYEAVLLSDGRVLRLSVDTTTIYAICFTVLPYLAIILCMLLFFEYFLSERLTRSFITPITEMGRHLEDIELYVPYPELMPLAEALAEDRELGLEREQYRREFTTNVSHELKTPLTAISGYAELIEDNMAKPEDIPKFAGHIHQEANRMLALIQDIIKLSELESHPTDIVQTPDMKEVDLYEIAENTVQRLLLRAENANIVLVQEGEAAITMGNASLLSELCENLVENAIRYNHVEGNVRVSTGIHMDHAFLCVQDDGIGIPKSAQTRIFERFYRVDKSRSKATGGTGLGLSIVKHIALMHKAEIFLDSEVGVGTTILVLFP